MLRLKNIGAVRQGAVQLFLWRDFALSLVLLAIIIISLMEKCVYFI